MLPNRQARYNNTGAVTRFWLGLLTNVTFRNLYSVRRGGVAGVPEARPLSVDSIRGDPLSGAQACILVGSEEAPELQIVVAGQALEPASEVPPQYSHAAYQHRVTR